MDETEDMGMDHLGDGDGFMAPKMYRHNFRCRRCGHKYHRDSPLVSLDAPPCPRKVCRLERELEAQKADMARLMKMFEDGTGPAHIGMNVGVKAVDETARIVMEDYHLTDLKDNIREGETMAPKLPLHQQQAADNFFNPSAAARKQGGVRVQQRMQNLGLMAMKGALGRPAFDPGVVAQKAGIPLGTPALRMVRSEKAR
jgi:hypothetical protein